MNTLTFDPVFRPALIAVIATALALLALVQARRTRALLGLWRALLTCLLRLAFVAGLAIVMMRPMRLQSAPSQNSMPTFSILLDRSASMDTKDVANDTRAAAVARALEAARNQLDGELCRNYAIRCYDFSDQIRPESFDAIVKFEKPVGERTDIATALFSAAEAGGARQAGMLLISDGRVSQAAGSRDVLDAARYLRARNIPVWTTAVGDASKVHDVLVTARLDQNFLFINQPGAIQATIEQSGYKGWQAAVHLKREGVEVGTQQTLLPDGPAQLDFPIREATAGLYQYEVTVDPLQGEADPLNNRRTVLVRATDRHTQILVLEAQPYWDTKFLLRALRTDPNLEVTAIFKLNNQRDVTIHQAPEAQGADATATPEAIRVPRTREELFNYDLVILGRGAEQLFSADELKMFQDYLTERGGNIIFARGKAYDRTNDTLAAIEPVVWKDDKLREVRFSLTDQGRETSLFTFNETADPNLMIREMPPMLSVNGVEKEKSLAVVLARTDAADPSGANPVPVISWQRYGKGKVLSMGGAGMWRWSLVPDNLERYQNIYQEFWLQTVHWMIASSDFLPDQQITFGVNRNTIALGDKAQLTVRTRLIDPAIYRPTIEITRQGAPPVRLEPQPLSEQPGTYGANFVPDAEGEYQATLQNNTGRPQKTAVRFTVYQDSMERRFVAADTGLMAQIARTTGGQALELSRLGELPDRLHRFEQAALERPRRVDAWDKPWIYFLLIGFIGCEWLVRRLSGLV